MLNPKEKTLYTFKTLALHLIAIFFATFNVIPVNIASIAGLGTQGSSIAYAASKAGVVNLTRSLARALAPNVRVNAVAPGQTATPWTESWSSERKQIAVDKSVLKKRSQPEDIAEAVLFLCAGASMMTGQTIVVDGGMTL